MLGCLFRHDTLYQDYHLYYFKVDQGGKKSVAETGIGSLNVLSGDVFFFRQHPEPLCHVAYHSL